MKRVLLLLGLLFVASSSVVSADDVDMFKRLQNPDPSVRLASAQDSSSADVSDSYPTQYVDQEVLDDMATPLIEQEAVSAEAAAQGRLDGAADYVADGSVIDPIASNAGVACGCGEGPLQQDSWDVAPCCPSVCCVRRHGCRRGGGHGCHLTRRLHCLHARAACGVAAAPVCIDPCAVDPCAVDPCAVDPCVVCAADPCAGGHGCHLAGRRRGCHHGRGGGHGGHLLRHIRCCR